MNVNYSEAELPVAADTAAAHEATLQAFAQPGAWWSGADRLAIVEEARSVAECSPSADAAASTKQDDAGVLPPAAIEAINGIRNRSGQLTRGWFENLIDMGLPQEAYVEIASVVASSVIVDTFAQGLGLDKPPLPAAEPGEPSFEASTDVADSGAWVPIAREGSANILRSLGLVPSALKLFFDTFRPSYYMRPGAKFALDVPQVELVAARVSAVNECFY